LSADGKKETSDTKISNYQEKEKAKKERRREGKRTGIAGLFGGGSLVGTALERKKGCTPVGEKSRSKVSESFINEGRRGGGVLTPLKRGRV